MEFFAELVQVLGVPASVGQIYGLLYGSACPLSFTDIAGRLDISKGSISQGLQFLRSLGAIRSIRGAENSGLCGARGDFRREQFLPEIGLRRLMSGILREKIDPLLGNGGTRMRRLREAAHRKPGGAGAKFCFERVKRLETWRRQLGLFLPLIRTFLVSG